MIDRRQMVEALIEAFPSLEEDIKDEVWTGLVYLEVGCFTKYTQERINSGDREELKRCFELARRFMLDGDPEVKNAMNVSYLEHLNLRNQKKMRSWAFEEMPEILKAGRIFKISEGGE